MQAALAGVACPVAQAAQLVSYLRHVTNAEALSGCAALREFLGGADRVDAASASAGPCHAKTNTVVLCSEHATELGSEW